MGGNPDLRAVKMMLDAAVSAAVEEAVARKLAHLHFDRREWRGACSKAERTAWLVERYWPQWRGDAAEVVAFFESGGE